MTVMRSLLFVLDARMPRECECDDNVGVGDEGWLC